MYSSSSSNASSRSARIKKVASEDVSGFAKMISAIVDKESDGAAEGELDIEGASEATIVGIAEATAEGSDDIEGDIDGTTEGTSEGASENVGDIVGPIEGTPEGTDDGPADGSIVSLWEQRAEHW